MNGRTASLMFVALLGIQIGAFAETETEAQPAAESVSQAAPIPAATAPSALQPFVRPLDFRSVRVADGMVEGSSGVYKAFGVGLFVAAGADLASTELGLRQPGVYEMNPVQGNRAVRVLTHVAAPAFMYWVTDKMHASGKPKLALLTRIGFSVGYSYVVMHNLRTAGTP